MKHRIRIYVGSVVVLSIATLAYLYLARPSVSASEVTAGATFALLGFLSELLAYKRVGRNETASIAFLPFLAGVVLAPVWTTAALVMAAVALAQPARRRKPIKSTFNVAQLTLATSLAAMTYAALGGRGMLAAGRISILAAALAAATYVVTNIVALSGAIATSEAKNFLILLRRTSPAILLYDLFALPFIFVFAWIYIQFGILGAVALTIPLLGVRELYRTNWCLQQANQELLELMVAAIEARDPYTSGHSRRVADGARVIANLLGVTERVADRVEVAGLLHDVGKIHEVFAAILQKPGRLTLEEDAIMRTHPIKSAELVERVSQLKDVLAPIRHHHENWDGTGYPDGLAGERIPLAARIIMFADTIDAMTTDRPYRNALDESAVREELIRFRGKQFDPRICDVLLSSPRFGELFRHLGQQTRQRGTVERPKLSIEA